MPDNEQEAQRRWEAGLVVPHHITTALDAKGLYGPAVDEACGAREPDVDRWESGDLYPSWAQLCALAELTEVTVAYFVRPASEAIDASWTTLRFHTKAKDMPKPPVLEFKASARTAMTQATLW